MENSITLKERFYGAIMGAVIGDAMGVPYEFQSSSVIKSLDMPLRYEIQAKLEPTYTVPPGTWSDDSAQMLCLLQCLIDKNGLDLDYFASLLLSWLKNGLWAVDGNVFDCGRQTAMALEAYENGMEVKECGFVKPEGKGNGALMRVLPIALWYHDEKNMVFAAHEQCLITHGHISSQVCCALYCLIVREILQGKNISAAYGLSINRLWMFYHNLGMVNYSEELELYISNFGVNGNNQSHVMDSLGSALGILLRTNSYSEVIKAVIENGNDTDTVGTIAGGLAGAYYGSSSFFNKQGVPQHLQRTLRNHKAVREIIKKLIKLKLYVTLEH